MLVFQVLRVQPLHRVALMYRGKVGVVLIFWETKLRWLPLGLMLPVLTVVEM
jgi:hypothetical protein